jgi:ribose transport system substrate-binding protein
MKHLLIVPVFAGALLLTACSGGADASGDSDLVGPVGYSARYVSDPFQAAQVTKVAAEAEAQGVEMFPMVNADNDPAKQNADIAALISRGARGIITNPADPQAIIPAIERANAAGGPVVVVDSSADGGEIAMAVTSDNYQAGVQGCEALGERVPADATVLHLQGELVSQNGTERSQGFLDCMAEKYPDITIISKVMEWQPDKCAEVTRTQMSTTPIDGIYTASSSVCLGPVATVLEGLGRNAPVGEPGHVPFVGIDGSADELQGLRDGILDAVISQPLNDFAKYAIFWLKESLAGEKLTTGPTDHGSEVVNVNGTLTDKLPVTTVTIDNVDDPALWGNQ